jgi:hypothetical protein
METPLALYDALLASNVPADKARAVVQAMEHDMTSVLATKSDLNHLDQTMDLKLKAQTNSIVVRLGGLILGVIALLEAIHRLL